MNNPFPYEMLPPAGRAPQLTLSKSVTIETHNEYSILQNVALDQSWDQGLPQLHVYTEILNPFTGELLHPNSKLQLSLAWSCEQGGGNAVIDIQRGAAFSFGASQKSLTATVRYVPINDTVAQSAVIIPGTTLVSLVIGGIGVISGQRPVVTRPRFLLGASASSRLDAVPAMARRARVLTDVKTPTTEIAFYGDAAGTQLIYITKGEDWNEIATGALFYKIVNDTPDTTINAAVVFELAL